MRKILGTLVLGVTALILLAAVALGVLLATFNPNDYKPYFSKAVQKATGRQLVFYGDIEMSFFPTLGLKTGKLALSDAGPFGDEPFLTIEGASVSVALEPLLSGLLEVQDLSLIGPSLKLATNGAGQHNWDYGFSKGTADDARARAQDGVVALEQEQNDEALQDASSFALLIRELSCKDLRLVYRDLYNGASYSGTLDDFSLSGLRRDADMPVNLAGQLKDEYSGHKFAFSLKALLRAMNGGALGADIEALDIRAEGLAAVPVLLSYRGGLRYSPDEGRVFLENAQGLLSLPPRPGQDGAGVESAYRGRADFTQGRNTAPPALNADLNVDNLDLEALLRILDPSTVAPDAEVKGAPNLPRPKVSAPKKGAPQNPKGEESAKAFAAINTDLNLTIEALTLEKLPMRSVRIQIRTKDGQAELPFSLELFGGSVSGKAAAKFQGNEPAISLNAQARGLHMENATRSLSGKYTITGRFSAALDVTGKGASAPALLHSLKGKVSAEAVGGEIRGFKLIPGDLPNFKAVPESFAYQRMAASATIAQGVASSRDITLASPVLTGRGGGTAQLALGQLDLGIDFMLAGMPPAVPVSIRGPYASLSYGVDMRTFLRNVAESAARSPESARDLLRQPEDAARGLIRQLGGQLYRQ